MKIKLFFLLMLAANISGFSQRNINFEIFPEKEYETTISLHPTFGKGEDINVLVSLIFLEERKLKIEFKNDSGNEGKFIYSFSKKMFYKDIMKEKKEIWFDKSLKNKYQDAEMCIDIPALGKDNIKYEDTKETIRTLNLSDPRSSLTFQFQKTDTSKTWKIPMKLYVAKKQKQKPKSDKDRKIEYLSKFTLIITMQTICDRSELKALIKSIEAETNDLESQNDLYAAELELLSEKSCTIVKDLKKKTPDNKEKIAGIKDPQYQQFLDCENLKKTINNYNNMLSERNATINQYNNKLDARKKECNSSSSPSLSPPNCSAVDKANKKLATLVVNMKNDKQTEVSAFEREYETIKKSVESQGLQKCEEYDNYRDWCNRVERQLKEKRLK